MNATTQMNSRRGARCFSGMLIGVAAAAFAGTEDLVKPAVLIADHSLPKVDAQILAARRYDTFWSTGDEALARAALALPSTTHCPTVGRKVSTEALKASHAFRTAVPDLHCDVRQMIVAGDRVVTHLHFTGHFTGSFVGKQGQGQVIDFIATDIYRVADGRIAEDWHLEDNLTFLQQAGLAAK